MTTPSPQEASPQKGSPRKLKPHDFLQRPIEEGRVGDEPYVPPTRAVDIDPVDIDTRPPEERAALNLWADEFCTTGQKSYLEQVQLAKERAVAKGTSIANNIVVPSTSANTDLAQSLAAAERLIRHPQPGQLVLRIGKTEKTG